MKKVLSAIKEKSLRAKKNEKRPKCHKRKKPKS